MKFCSAVLALCILGHASAFFVKAPNTLTYKGHTEVGMSTPNFFASQQTPSANSGLSYGASSNQPKKDKLIQQPEKGDDSDEMANVWEALEARVVQGGSLETWPFPSTSVKRMQVLMKTEGRPLNANVELWQGPDNAPQTIKVYIEDGTTHPFSVVIEAPYGYNTVAIRNTGNLEFPLTAAVGAVGEEALAARPTGKTQVIQGGALKTHAFEPSIKSVSVLLTTNGRPLNSRLELLQGPNNDKQVMYVYCEDGKERPFHVILATPGTGNVLRIQNTSPVEFPIKACVEPYIVED